MCPVEDNDQNLMDSKITIKSKWEIQFNFPFWVTSELNMAPRIDDSREKVFYTHNRLYNFYS
jgi:hypothetical protein